MRLICLLVLALALIGCSTKLQLQSDTSWSGSIGGGSVSGSGSRTWSIHGGDCASFQKQTEGGYLKARTTGWHGQDRWVYTDAAYGVVTVCAER